MKQALCIGHSFDYDPGYVGVALARHGYQLTQWNRESTVDDVPAVTDFDLIVPLGSEWSAWNPASDEQRVHIKREQALLAEAMRADIPVLGICFGMQQLALALGGDVHLAAEPEIGVVKVPAQDDDPFGLAGDWTTFHLDSVTPPPGATLRASTDICAQSFSIGRALAVQYHPEAGPEVFQRWVYDGGRDVITEVGHDPEAALAAVNANVTQAQRTDKLVDAFVEWIAR
jgi:GMP synthase-like glutamine amidotransferase